MLYCIHFVPLTEILLTGVWGDMNTMTTSLSVKEIVEAEVEENRSVCCDKEGVIHLPKDMLVPVVSEQYSLSRG